MKNREVSFLAIAEQLSIFSTIKLWCAIVYYPTGSALSRGRMRGARDPLF